MKSLLLTLVVLFGVTGSTLAQKRSTLMGDIVVGELTGKDDVTREITIKYSGKEGPEMFSGILVDAYKLRTEDGQPSDMKLTDIMPGMHIRVFYKTGNENHKKINKISRLDVLGEDKYFRVRKQLNLSPSTPIAPAETEDLPAGSPLKVYLAISNSLVNSQLVVWINKWNQKNGDSYGKLEPVSDLEQADFAIVVARGSDVMVAALPMMSPDGGKLVEGVWSHATSYLVVKDAGRLKVLWTGVAPVFTRPDVEVSLKTTELVIAEMEKRMKSTSRK